MSPITNILTHPEFLRGMVAFAAVLLLGWAIILWVKRWQRCQSETAISPEKELEQFRGLHQQGDLSEEELERIRLLVQAKAVPGPGKPPEGEVKG